MDKDVIEIKILGMKYKISCPPEERDQVQDAAKFFDSKLKEIKENSKLDENKAAIIAGLNISNDYLKNLNSSNQVDKSKSDIQKLSSEIKRHVESMTKLDDE